MPLSKLQSRVVYLTPSILNHLGAEVIVRINELFDNNRYEYELRGKKILFEYTDKTGFHLYRNLISGDVLTFEGTNIKMLEFSGSKDSFIDIGAHYGIYSVVVGTLNPDSEIYCFEPNDFNRRMVQHQLQINDIRAEVRPEVVSETAGTITFYESDENGSQSHSATKSEMTVKEVEKDAVSIGEFIQYNDLHRPFLKIDAEGEEQKIIRDLVQLDGRDISGILEVHPRMLEPDESEEQILRLFDDHGYHWEELDAPSISQPQYYFQKQ